MSLKFRCCHCIRILSYALDLFQACPSSTKLNQIALSLLVNFGISFVKQDSSSLFLCSKLFQKVSQGLDFRWVFKFESTLSISHLKQFLKILLHQKWQQCHIFWNYSCFHNLQIALLSKFASSKFTNKLWRFLDASSDRYFVHFLILK